MTFSNPQEMGRPIRIEDEGVPLTSNVAKINFTGAGVTGIAVGDDITETIPGGSVSGTEVVGETPSGTINGVNTDFTLANNPILVRGIYRGGSRQSETDDYTIITNTITFLIAPQVGENIKADYVY